jgi:hypothetical protein
MKIRVLQEVCAGDALKSSGLLHVEASLARVSQSSLNTGGSATDGWCTWHHRGDCVECKLKTDMLMRWAASDAATLPLSFSMYYALRA